jgi:hypothetical protein
LFWNFHDEYFIDEKIGCPASLPVTRRQPMVADEALKEKFTSTNFQDQELYQHPKPKHLLATWRPAILMVKQAPEGIPHFLQREKQPCANVPEGTGIGIGRQTLPTTGSLKQTLLLTVRTDTQVALCDNPGAFNCAL